MVYSNPLVIWCCRPFTHQSQSNALEGVLAKTTEAYNNAEQTAKRDMDDQNVRQQRSKGQGIAAKCAIAWYAARGIRWTACSQLSLRRVKPFTSIWLRSSVHSQVGARSGNTERDHDDPTRGKANDGVLDVMLGDQPCIIDCLSSCSTRCCRKAAS